MIYCSFFRRPQPSPHRTSNSDDVTHRRRDRVAERHTLKTGERRLRRRRRRRAATSI